MAVLLSTELEHALKSHGIPTKPHLGVIDCDAAVPLLNALAPEKNAISVYANVDEAVKGTRSHRLTVILCGAQTAQALLRALNDGGLTVGVIAHVPEGSSVSPAVLRSFGAMDIAKDLNEATLLPLLRRGMDFRALLALELAHRCESKRLERRELELLGHPPETMSDDLNTFQPPPLPVGPMSTYNLDEASEAFERAYIDRVQHLCASAREAAIYLGVSSATLSRRTRKENSIHGEYGE
jgi:hypothetical protein